MTIIKPDKKSDHALLELLSDKISQGDYFFTKHAKQRLIERELLELEVLDILTGRLGRKRKRNKSKEKYSVEQGGWNYCIEGISVNSSKIRIIFSYTEENIIIITVIRARSLIWTRQ